MHEISRFLVMMNVMDINELTLISGAELAKLHGYSSVTSQCRSWWSSLGIKPLPGRKNIYDPMHVRERLNEASQLSSTKLLGESTAVSLVDKRKARKLAK